MLINFSWIKNNKLAGCGQIKNKQQISDIKKLKIDSILTLTEKPILNTFKKDFNYLHIPMIDFSFPGLKKINKAIDFIEEEEKGKRVILIHCKGGTGRTGLILVCYLIKFENFEPDKAIAKIRSLRPNSIRSPVQQLAIDLFFIQLQLKKI